MPDDEEQICGDCGKSQGRKGSLTQWVGIGEHCRCGMIDQTKTGPHKRSSKRETKCKRCLKIKPPTNQSITQWLFKKQFCQCKPDTKIEAPQIAISPRKIHELSNSKKLPWLPVFAASAASLLIVGLIIYVVFSPPKIDHSMANEKENNERYFLYGFPNGTLHREKLNRGSLQIFKEGNFTKFAIYSSRISDLELSLLADCPQLTELEITNCRGYSEHGIDYLVKHSKITSLSMEGSFVTAPMITSFSTSHLCSLSIPMDYLFVQNLSPLLKSDTLRVLRLSGTYEKTKAIALLSQGGFHDSFNSYRR